MLEFYSVEWLALARLANNSIEVRYTKYVEQNDNTTKTKRTVIGVLSPQTAVESRISQATIGALSK